MDTTARGLLMLSPRLRLRLSPATAMVATAVDMAAMAMVATVGVMEAMARGLLSPAMATGATVVTVVVMAAMAMAAGTTVSYHRIRRSELSQKQNHKNSH